VCVASKAEVAKKRYQESLRGRYGLAAKSQEIIKMIGE
jgi:hypothetical protein